MCHRWLVSILFGAMMTIPHASHALTITGTVSTSASPAGVVPPTGKIIVTATSTTTGATGSASLMLPRPFTITSLPSGQSFNLTAFIDANDNQTLDPMEWSASYASNPIVLSSDKSGVSINITLLDSDWDGLPDLDEMNIYGTNPLSMDTDSEGMPDKYEVDHHLDPRRDDSMEDRDFDFVSNIDEYLNGSNPNSAYSDSSGLSDYQKLNGGQGKWEAMYDRNDRLLGMRYDRGIALGYAYDGNGNMVRQMKLSLTSAGDGLPDPWKVAYGLDPHSSAAVNGPSGDPDGDGWSNYQEFMAGTDPTSATSHPGGESSIIASTTTLFIPTHFVAATGQLDGAGPDELAVGADGDPGSQANAIKVYTKTDTGWSVESIPVGAFGVTSMAIGKPVGASVTAIYAGLRASSGTGSIVELKKTGTTWTTTTLISSTDSAAYVTGILNGTALTVILSKTGDNPQALYKLSLPSTLTQIAPEASTIGLGTVNGKLSENSTALRITASGNVQVVNEGFNTTTPDIASTGKLFGWGHASTCGLLRTGATTTGVDGMSVFSAFVDDLNANGTADANDQFTVSEFLISGTSVTIQSTYRLPMPDNANGLSYAIATFKQLGGTMDVLATGEPDGGLYIWKGPKTSGVLSRRLIERHSGKLWHDLVSHQGTETGEGLVGLEVDPASPATYDLIYWSPDALDRLLSKPIPQNPPGTKLLSTTMSGGAYPQVNVKIWDAESNAAHPTLQWQNMTNGQWNDARLLSLDGAAYSASTSCESSPTGVQHMLIWNAAQDLGLNFKSGLMLRARSSDASGFGAWSAPTFYFVDLTRDSHSDGLPDNWKLANNLDLNLTTPLDDYSHDGVSNLMKFALGMNPRQSSVEGMPAPSNEGDYLTLTVPRNPAAANLHFDVQVSGSMDNWQSGANHVTILENSPTRLKARDNVPISSSSQRFIRVAVASQAPALPTITQQPTTATILPGTTTTLAASAQGSSLAYQWETGTPGGMFQPILGANNATYTTPPLATDTMYRVIVTNSCGSSVSAAALVWPTNYLAISEQPRSQTGVLSANITLAVSVVGVATGYQWKKNGTAIPGATNSSLILSNIQMEDVGAYTVSVTGAQYSVTSNFAFLRVTPEPGYAYAFGLDQFGQLGNGVPDTKVPAAVYMSGALSGKQVVALASGGGGGHNLALTSDGKVYAWGGNDSGQIGDGTTTNRTLPVAVNMNGVLQGNTVIAIAAGDRHSLAISSDGKVYAWGSNSSGELGDGTTTQRTIPVAVNSSGVLFGRTIVAISAGDMSSLALTSEGKVYSWGINLSGQLGDGTTTQRTLPVAVNMSGVLLGKTVTSIASGTWHSLALTSEGKVYAWGSNSTRFDGGQLGDGTTTQRTLPVAVYMEGVLQGKRVTSITAGISQSYALTSEGKVYAWGENDSGQLGNGTTTSSTLPVVVNTSAAIGGQTVRAISAGIFHCLALTSGGQVFSWGDNSGGCLGDGTDTWRTNPVAVKTDGLLLGKSVVLIAAGNSTSIAMTSDNLCYAWGDYSQGQLGNDSSMGRTVAIASNTIGVLSGKPISMIAAGWNHALALTPVGHLFAWGNNSNGQLGNGLITNASAPVSVDTGAKIMVAIAGGNVHSLALTQEGEVYSWGYNGHGELGDGTFTQRNSPVAVDMNGKLSGKYVNAIAVGLDFCLVLASDGLVYTWGNNVNGQLGDGTTLQRTTPVAVDMSGVLNGKTVAAIATGRNHSLALSSDGHIYAWGNNANGQLGDGTTTQRKTPVAVNMGGVLNGKDVVAIAAGEGFSLVLTAEGKVYAWGSNGSGQLGDGTNTQRTLPVAVNMNGVLSGKIITLIAAGQSHSVVLTNDRKAYSWGSNNWGQIGDGTTTSRVTPVAVDMTGVLQGKTVTGISAGYYYSILTATP